MALSVQTNNAAITALKHLNMNNTNMNKSLERLSSGFRINSAADDASGFAVASKLGAQSEGLKAASQNAIQATAMVKMADAGVNEIQNMIVRIQTLATQAASANAAGELGKLDAERIKLEDQIDKIANSTKYSGVTLLNGSGGATGTTASAGVTGIFAASGTTVATSAGTIANTGATQGTYTVTVSTAPGDGGTGVATFSDGTNSQTVTFTDVTDATASATVTSSLFNFSIDIGSNAQNATTATIGTVTIAAGASNFQVGADNSDANRVSVGLSNNYQSASLGLGAAGAGIDTQANAQAYITTAQNALDTLILQRADLGATQNQLSFVSANLATSIEQVQAAVSSIKDADMAQEMAEFTKNQILTQAGTSMLAQANQASQNVLSLFR